ncbi:MAG TPA: adenylate/guanylate cyclase domain-containing protein [Ohtaekwangia sp.]|uniref:adenylate/guanylate cyclase domain-containing protein n=1 Tax=Ohtaekwangia sp. TaxID=2066019 RepID=UPI002F95A8FC
MTRSNKLRWTQLGIITIAWLLLAIFMTVYDHLVLHSAYSTGIQEQYSFLLSMFFNMGSALMGSLLGGSFLVFYVNVKFQDKPYGYTVAAVILWYIVVISLIMLTLGLVAVPLRTGKPFFDPASQEAFSNFLHDTSRTKNIMYWLVVVAFTQLVLQINNKFGQGVFWKIIRGLYNTPREETRIFMFLDLNASTTIAETLGNEKYHELLKDFFADITYPILENKGEIYQYVGDEVVVAWTYRDGVENNHCIKCFFDIKQHINKNEAMYKQRYGLVPSFKAGIHCGKVIAGEIGIIKRDITYSGDVLNTTSRIQQLCKEFKKELIVSGEVLSELRLPESYRTNPLGSIQLRGKEKHILVNELSAGA